ncbi:MAG: hypothetical protein EZS28_033092, partial [Streblomastix strix]
MGNTRSRARSVTPPQTKKEHVEKIINIEHLYEDIKRLFENPLKDSIAIDFPRFAKHIALYTTQGQPFFVSEKNGGLEDPVSDVIEFIGTIIDPNNITAIVQALFSERKKNPDLYETVPFKIFIKDYIKTGTILHQVMKTISQIHLQPVMQLLYTTLIPEYNFKDGGNWMIEILVPTQLSKDQILIEHDKIIQEATDGKGKQVILQEILEVDEENRKSILIQQGIDPDGEEGRRIFNEGTLMR